MFNNRPEMDSPEYKSWRNRVMVRDEFTCALCGPASKGKRLEIHHIVPWSKNEQLRYVPSNGICLCTDCHKTVTGKEDVYEDQFKRLVAQKKMQKQKDLGIKAKSKFKEVWFKYRPRNPNMRF